MDIGPVRRRLVAEPVIAPIPAAEPRPEPREQVDAHPASDAVVTTDA